MATTTTGTGPVRTEHPQRRRRTMGAVAAAAVLSAAFGIGVVLDTPGGSEAPTAGAVSAGLSQLTPAQQAEAARWTAMAEAYARTRAAEAETARWQGMADAYDRQRAADAEADRWQARGDAFLEETSGLTPAQQAERDRLSGLADEYLD